MDKTNEKLSKFSLTVMAEAEKNNKEIVNRAENERQKAVEDNEIRLLEQAYESIQEAIHKINKDANEKVSRVIIHDKEKLLNNRQEVINSIFRNITDRLIAARHLDGYKTYLENLIKRGISEVGRGVITVLAESEDIQLLEEIRTESGLDFEIAESDDKLLGGCIIINKTKGLLCDYSFENGIKKERADFMENYGNGTGID